MTATLAPDQPAPPAVTGLSVRTAARMHAVTSSAIRDLLALTARPDVLSMAGGLPAPDAFPASWIRDELDRCLRSDPSSVLQYATTEGHLPLREQIALAEGRRDDRPVSPDEILVTSGSQQGLDLLARALLDPGDLVAVEDPAYLGALQVLRLAGAELLAIPVDGDGLRTDVLEERLRAGARPRLVTVVPNFQNPTGVTLSFARRQELARLADRYGFWIVEDDPYHELRFGGPTPPPLRSFSDRVIRLGSFSKVVAPGLRAAWLTAPADLVRSLVLVKQAADLQTSSLVQPVLATMLADRRRFEAHLHGLRGVYAERAQALGAALRRHLGDAVHFTPSTGGMFTWARLHADVDTRALLPVALERGVAFVPGAEFMVDRVDRSCLRLGYATLSPRQIDTAVRRLADAIAATPPAP